MNRPALAKYVYALAYDLNVVAKAKLHRTYLRRRGVGAVALQDVLPEGKPRLDSLESSLARFLSCSVDLNPNVAAILSRAVSRTIEQIQDPIALSEFAEDLTSHAPLPSEVAVGDLGELGRALTLVIKYIETDELMNLWWSLGTKLAIADGAHLDSDVGNAIAKLSTRLHDLIGFAWLKRLSGLSSLAPGSTVLSKRQEPYIDREAAAITRKKLDVFIRDQLENEKDFKVLLAIDEAGVTLFDQHIPRTDFQDAKWSILLCLANSKGKEVARSKLFQAYQGIEGNNNNAVAAQISGLRKVLKCVFNNSNKPEDLPIQSVEDLIVGVRQENAGGPYKLALNPDQVEVNV